MLDENWELTLLVRQNKERLNREFIDNRLPPVDRVKEY